MADEGDCQSQGDLTCAERPSSVTTAYVPLSAHRESPQRNGAPDGIAIVDANQIVLEFIS